MERQKTTATRSLVADLFQFQVYKRSQGRIARQVTFAALASAILIGVWRLLQMTFMIQLSTGVRYALALGLAFVGIWIAFRVVNLPRFADFLIAVEAEMNKVSWPSSSELIRASIVVMMTIFSLAFILFLYDTIWSAFFRWLGVHA